MILGCARSAAVATLAAVVVLSCSSGPTSKEALCEGYDELSEQIFRGNGILGNPLFKSAGRLGDLASNYEGDTDVAADGDALRTIADSDETDGSELSDATRNIAAECDKPRLAANAFLGD